MMSPNFRKQELEDLVISFFVLSLVFSNFNVKWLPYVAVGLLTAFVFHELAHRQVAKHYGYIAFYKRWDTGIILALLIGILNRVAHTGFLFAAVGAVYIYAPYAEWDDREANGKISLAGPATNVVVGIVALVMLLTLPLNAFLASVLYYTASVNFWLAVFNLLPFPPLDGWKVFRWNPGYWAVAIGLAYLLNTMV